MADKQAKEIAVDQLDKVDVTYSGETQQLLISVPNDWLPKQTLGDANPEQRLPAQSSLGFLLNYDAYVSQSGGRGNPGYFSAWSEQRLFDGFGVIANTGIFRSSFNGETAAQQNNRYIRYDSSWRYSDDDTMLSYTAGDLDRLAALDQFGAHRRPAGGAQLRHAAGSDYLSAAAVLRPGRRAEQRRSVHQQL